jgi:hypothetical protein
MEPTRMTLAGSDTNSRSSPPDPAPSASAPGAPGAPGPSTSVGMISSPRAGFGSSDMAAS